MNALITGRCRIRGHRIWPSGCSNAAQRVIGVDCFTDYYARAIKESNLALMLGRPGFRFVESTIQEAELEALLDGVTHVFHLAAQAGVRRAGGATSRSTP